MSDLDPFTKNFVKAWARYTVALASVEQPVLNELKDGGSARQQAVEIFRSNLGTDVQRREVALKLALLEFQLSVEHA